jgi:hypothetical protein
MVEKNLSIKADFICLSDRPIDGVDCMKLVTPELQHADPFEGWWAKVSLFEPGLFNDGDRILYLDLDVVITGSLDAMAMQWAAQPLTMIYNFGPNRSHAAHNSSVMLWSANDDRLSKIYTSFDRKVMQQLHGDQCWIWRVLRENIANWPDEYVKSYKYDCRSPRWDAHRGLTRVVVFHGNPKPHEVRDAWVVKAWS